MKQPRDPPRLKDSGSSELRSLLESAKQDHPTAAELAEISSRVTSAIGTSVTTGAALTSAQSTTALLTVKSASIFIASVTVVGALSWIILGDPPAPARHEPGRPPTVSLPASFPASLSPAEPVLIAPEPTAKEPVKSSPAPATIFKSAAKPGVSPVPKFSPGSEDEGELRLMERGFQALRLGDIGAALAMVEEHHRRFENGSFAQEREVIWIESLARTGRIEEAKGRAAHFGKVFPGSGHRLRIEALLNDAGYPPTSADGAD